MSDAMAGEGLILFINKFFKPSHQYFDAYSRSKQEALSYSMKSAEVVLNQFYKFNDLSGKVILDYGCGRGGKTLLYAKKGSLKVIGVDVYPEYSPAADYAKQNNLPVEFKVLGEGWKIDLADKSVDMVISSSVTEHILNLNEVLQEIKRVLKLGGLFLNRWHPFRSRNGAHLQEAINIPFAHLLFGEKDVMRAYCKELLRIHGVLPEFFKRLDINTASYNNRHCMLNLYKVKAMRKQIASFGFGLLGRRFFVGKKEIGYIRLLPESVLDYFIDYEVQIWKKA